MDTGNSRQAHSHLLNQMTGRVVLQDTGLVHLLTHDGDKLIDHGHVDRHFGHHFVQLVADHNKKAVFRGRVARAVQIQIPIHQETGRVALQLEVLL